MKPDDFRYMHRGKITATLAPADAALLAPIEYEGPGRERALLLLHGFTSSPAVYRRLIPSLMMYDTLVCPVLPGHGESIDAFSKARAEDWLMCASRACERLVGTYQKVDVMGLSLGGVLACSLSQRFQLNHLYLLAPALALHRNLPLLLLAARVLRALGLSRIPNYAGNIHQEGHAELAYRQLPVNCIIEILSLIKTFQFAQPTCPVDVFLGRYDDVVSASKIITLFANLPDTHIHWLEHSAHVLPLDGDVDEIIACVRESCA